MLAEESIVAVTLTGAVTTGLAAAARMLDTPNPAVEAVPTWFVATQEILTTPVAPAVKLTLVPVTLPLREPPVIVQEKVQPAWAGVLAV